uniref:Sodium/hydrogen exchanger n=1 Tax=Methanococcus maripaludis (strain C6 / ATCC BAA-1332) TaxID=444158 RepID=A9A6D9_METM6
MDSYFLFFIILTSIFIVPQILKRFNVPTITATMLAGIIIGPFGLNLIQTSSTLDTFASFGVIFLMFLAGMEVDNETLKDEFKNSLVLSLFSMLIPSIGGYLIGQYFGLDFIGSLLYAVIFSSHSVGIVYALMDELGLIKSRFGTTVISASVVIDLISLIVISILIRMGGNGINADIIPFIVLIVAYIIALLIIIPLISKLILNELQKFHVQKIHFILLIILISIIVGEHIGIHPIIGAFIIGIAVSEELTKEEHDKILNENLNAIGYGIFIPLFFLNLGMTTDISVIFNFDNLSLIFASVVSLISLKIISGYFSLRILDYNKLKSFCGGLLTVPSLTASLVGATLGRDLGILPEKFFVAVVVIALLTSTVAPIYVKNLVSKNYDKLKLN